MDWASKPAACVHVFNTCIYLLCNIFKWYTTKYPTNQSYFLGIDIQYWSCFLTLLTPNVSKLLILLIVLLTPSLEAHLDWKRNFLCQQRESQTWNNLTKHDEQTLWPHSSNCTGYRRTSLHTGHWNFSASGNTNVAFIFSLGCTWAREEGLAPSLRLVGREQIGLCTPPAVNSYEYDILQPNTFSHLTFPSSSVDKQKNQCGMLKQQRQLQSCVFFLSFGS